MKNRTKSPAKEPKGGGGYKFKIEAYSPKTIPMSRLALYMGELATLLGEKGAVHFDRLTKGSTILNIKVEQESVVKVRDRIQDFRNGEGGEAHRAYKALNKLLRDDNANGSLRSNEPRGLVIPFPGRELAEEKFASVKQRGSIDGVITGIRGKDETIHIILQSEGRQISGCETTKTIAKQLGKKLFEPVRLFGLGRWSRDAEGVWKLERFKIEGFATLDDAPLTTALQAVRSIPWEWGEDPFNELLAIRSGSGGKQHGGH